MICVDCKREDCVVYITQTVMVGRIRLQWQVCGKCLVIYERSLPERRKAAA